MNLTTSNFTPLFQLNLFIHMGMDYQSGSPYVNPFLRNLGYKIKYIGYPIPVKPETHRKLKKSLDNKVNKIVVPEIIYEHQHTKNIILLECKVLSFSEDLSERAARQAVGYLSLSGDYVASYLGIRPSQLPEAKLLYAIDSNFTEDLKQTLNALSLSVVSVTGDTITYDVVGMEKKDDGVYFNTNDGSFKVIDGSVTENPAVLYLIPIDPELDFEDQYGREVLMQQVRSSIVSKIGRLIGYTQFEFTALEVCQEIIPVWDSWVIKPKKNVRRLVRTYIDGIVSELNKKGLTIECSDGSYIIPKVDHKTADKIRNYLRSTEASNYGSDIIENFKQIEMEEYLEEMEQLE